jgi:hypothetical protein
MMRQRWGVGSGVVLALLFLSATGRADEAEAVKAIEKAGGKITVDDKQPNKPVVAVLLWGPGIKVEVLKELQELKSLQKLKMGGPWITDEGLKELKGLKSLQLLELRSPKITETGLKELKEALPEVKVVYPATR